MKINIALVGDYNDSITAHQAIPLAIGLGADALQVKATFQWVPTEALNGETLRHCDAIWSVPGSPYQNRQGALTAIQFARRNNVPFLGTCGGYQHAILEYAQHALGFDKADNSEENPETVMPVISALSCPLVEKTASITLEAGSHVATFYQSAKIDEDYHCSFGVNPDYLFIFDGTDISFTGHDESGNPKILEIPDHRFFIGTAYQPERSALKNQVHPLIAGFLQAAVEMKIATG
jgi:CTP synthase (UTP-ammonia lyase)